jgi:hypothetical protein
MADRLTNPKAVDYVQELLEDIDYDQITEAQHDLVISFEEQFEKFGGLTEKQIEILEDIKKQIE